jgi:hypothetical protein
MYTIRSSERELNFNWLQGVIVLKKELLLDGCDSVK